MISHFPPTYPDETLYSVVGRCATRLERPTFRSLTEDLFESRHARAKIDLPDRLEVLARNIPGELHGKADRIAQELTLLPFYLPFLPVRQGAKLKQAMLRTTPVSDRTIPAMAPLKLCQPASLMFCRQCWKEDEAGGERYWRRSHQAPGVLICPVHGQPLWESSVAWSFRKSWQQYVDAADIKLCDCTKLRLSDSDIFLRLARDAQWLLTENTYYPGSEEIGQGYFDALMEKGLTKGSSVRLEALRRHVVDKVGRSVLARLKSDLKPGSQFSWLSQLVRPSQSARMGQPPFRHLLLIHALDHSVETFFAAMQRPHPMDAFAAKLELSETQSRVESIRAWWDDEKVSVCSMAKRLGMNSESVGEVARRAGLPFPRRNKMGEEMHPGATEAFRRKQEGHRRDFRRFQREQPSLGLKALGRLSGCVKWLRNHDRTWLEANRPAYQSCGGAPGIDWAERDTRCADRIPAIIDDLRSSRSSPSVSAIERALGLRVGNMKARLPKTAVLLSALR